MFLKWHRLNKMPKAFEMKSVSEESVEKQLEEPLQGEQHPVKIETMRRELRPQHRSTCTFSQLITVVAISVISLVIGYATAYTSPSEVSLRKDMHLGNAEISWIAGLMPLTAVFGGLLGGLSIQYCGRKGTLFFISVLFLMSWLTMCYAKNVNFLYLSRCFAGCSIGLATLTLPIYLVETIQTEVRCVLGLLPVTFGNIGILLCYAYGMFVKWRTLAAIGLIFSLLFPVLFVWIIPETPTWYIQNDKPDKCKETLLWLRNVQQDVTIEFNDLVRIHNEEKSKNKRIMTMLKQPNLKPLIIILSLMFFQQFSGINAVIFYSTSIFSASKWKLSPAVCTTVIGLVNLLATVFANGLIHRIGRKMLLLVSSILMTVGLGSLGFYYYLKEILHVDVEDYGFLTLIHLSIFIAGFSIGFGLIPWLLMTELLPDEIKSLTAHLATAVNWICTFIITVTFPSITQMFGYFAVFWFYCCMVITSGLLTWLFVPETKGRAFIDIDRRPSGQNIQNAVTTAMIKPFPTTTM